MNLWSTDALHEKKSYEQVFYILECSLSCMSDQFPALSFHQGEQCFAEELAVGQVVLTHIPSIL